MSMGPIQVKEASASYLASTEGQEAPPGYKRTDMGVIPEDWSVIDYVSSGQVIDGDRGVNYPSAGDLQDSGYCLFLNAGNVTKEGFRFGDCQFISVEKDKKLNKGKLIRGDVVLTTRGTVGNFAYYGDDVPFEHMRINSGMVILRNLSSTVSNYYQYLVLWSHVVESQLERLSFGSAQPQLTVKGISTLQIPLPPTATEQRSITEALSDVNGLLGALEVLINKKRAIKQAAMQQLLTGKTRLPGFSEEWEEKTFGEIFDYRSTATNSRNDLSDDGDTYYVHYGDIHTRFHSHLDFRCDQPPKIDRQRCKNAALIQNGDWIMADASEDFDGVGKSIEITGINDGVAAVSGLHTFLLREKVQTFEPGFKGHLGNLKSLHEQFLRVATGMKVYGVSKTALKALSLPIPSPKEQTAITSILSDMDAEIASLEQRRDKTKHIKQGMMQQLLTGRVRLVSPETSN